MLVLFPLLKHPQTSRLFYTKKTTFLFIYFTHLFLQNIYIDLSILHIYSIKYSFFYKILLFSPLSPFSLTGPLLPTIPPHPATVITTQPTSSRKTNSLNLKPSQSQIHSIPNPFITHPTRNPVKPNHHPSNLKPTDDLMIWLAWFDDRRGLRLMIWSAIGLAWWFISDK